MGFLSWAGRLLSGFLPVSGEKVGKILWVAGICFLVLITVRLTTKPTNSYSGPVKQIYTENLQAKYGFFGCSMGHARGGLQWKW